ncbi:hypothetical protein BUALT_Bualt17G0035700 [Buddleja alternifolia]|uniref:Protein DETOXIFICATION n=1 Tax=Buddleja alternifolia TaxID=168488 RepID=A0AAV6WBD7_9LAMI|nr:hypothetical protein BUALT_Bualt17G0035700 [Buddleja alternifolia]
MDDNCKQTVLSPVDNEQQIPLTSTQNHSTQPSQINPIFSSFVAGENDMSTISSVSGFVSEFKKESRKLWYLAGPAFMVSVCQFSLGSITSTFTGHVGSLELAAFSVENMIISGFSFGLLLGMGSALETLCGQAYGAGQIKILGIYLQRSWIILLCTSFLLTFPYIFAEPLLVLIGQKKDISLAAGRLARWMIPQLYAYAFQFPISKFLQAQSRIMVMAWLSMLTLVLHAVFSWLVMMRLRWGLAGGALVLNASWWFLVVTQMIYIFCGACGEAWSGFSWKAFQHVWAFVRLSIASAVMICLEVWYFTALLLFAGYLKNAETSVDALSICINILMWTSTIAFGFNGAISVRVSNELGAAHPRKAKFSVVVVVISTFLISLVTSAILLICQKHYPSLFSDSSAVKEVVYELTPMLALCIVINNIQPALSGMAIGAGWQTMVAYVDITCYYVFGIPFGLILGYPLKKGVKGIWYGMIAGTIIQTLVLFYIAYRTNWNKEATVAAERVKKWAGETNAKTDVEEQSNNRN